MLRGDCSVGSARMTSGCKCPCLYLQLLVVLFFFSLMGLLSTHLTPHVCHPSCLGFFPRLLETAGPQVPRLPGSGWRAESCAHWSRSALALGPGSLVTSPCWSSFHRGPHATHSVPSVRRAVPVRVCPEGTFSSAATPS